MQIQRSTIDLLNLKLGGEAGDGLWCSTICSAGNSLVVQWLGLSAFTAMARVQFLVRELRFRKLQGVVN